MGLEAKLVQKLSQSLLMTPQLQQAIKLLQLGRLEYQEALQKELLENPVLEEVKEGDEPPPQHDQTAESDPVMQLSDVAPTPSDSSESVSQESTQPDQPAEWEEYVDNLYSESRSTSSPKGLVDYEDRPGLEATLTKSETLHEYLYSQLRLLEIPAESENVVEYLVGNIDKDGYLCASYDEVAQACSCDVTRVEQAINILKTLDPPGIGARDLKECLLIQLDDLGLEDSLAAKIVAKHLDKVESRKFDQIVKSEQVALEDVYSAVTTIRELEPKPGRPFSDETVRYAIPDIYVYKVANEYVVSLNEDGLPRLRVSPYYLDLLRSNEKENAANKTYLTERLKAATFLIRSIHQRQQTIVKVTQSIVRFQKEFLDHGIQRLKPLTLREVADDIGMHESTVSRVTTNKYVHTPQGVFELKYFFTTGIQTGDGDVSSSSIKEKIRKIIEAESSDNPISDQHIVDMLKAENVQIARRTVAKYREGLGILSSSRRKKLF